MKIAVCQTKIEFEDYEANLSKIKSIVSKVGIESDLVLFPEMSITGFSMNTNITGEEDNRSIANIKEIAVSNKVAVGFGWVEGKEQARNHYTVIDEKGEIIADYVKIHPFSYSREDEFFVGGNSPCIFSYKGVNLGITICYDLRFPELFQAESKQAHIIITPANWPAKREKHWNALLMARAIENQVYMIGVNCVGDMASQYYEGDSQVITPDGEVLVKITDEETVKVIDFGDVKNRVEEVRKSFPVKNDRKEALYETWYKH